MYDRAPRFLPLRTQTQPSVAPNSYDPEIIEPCFESLAPFLSTTQRFPLRKRERRPGPGQYDVEIRVHIKGGESASYTDERFHYHPDDLPGPNTYDMAPKPKPPIGKGKLARGAPPLTLMGSTPSIPPKRGFYGYKKTASGQLKAFQGKLPSNICPVCCMECPKTGHACHCQAPPSDLSGTCFTTLRYKGCHFSHLTSMRVTFLPRDGPGPGDYDVQEPGPSYAWLQDEAIRHWKRKNSRQPRLAEIIERKSLVEGIPGVGQYNLLKPEVPKTSGKHGAFLCTGKRDSIEIREGPSPAEYSLDRELAAPKPGSLIQAPFLALANRFPPTRASGIPGPGTYTVSVPLGAEPGQMAAPFASTQERETGMARRYADIEPGPDSYETPTPAPKGGGCRSAFKTKEPRGGKGHLQKMPTCWTYNPKDPHVSLTSHHRGDISFCSRVPRFRAIRDWPSKAVDAGNPGPGYYNLPNLKCDHHIGNSLFGNSKRTTMVTGADIPGPGQYTLSRDIAPRTHNVTLDPEAIKRRNRRRVPSPYLWECSECPRVCTCKGRAPGLDRLARAISCTVVPIKLSEIPKMKRSVQYPSRTSSETAATTGSFSLLAD